jgi:hypothetical protein
MAIWSLVPNAGSYGNSVNIVSRVEKSTAVFGMSVAVQQIRCLRVGQLLSVHAVAMIDLLVKNVRLALKYVMTNCVRRAISKSGARRMPFKKDRGMQKPVKTIQNSIVPTVTHIAPASVLMVEDLLPRNGVRWWNAKVAFAHFAKFNALLRLTTSCR